MRLLFGSIAPLLLVMLIFGCNTVDPSECWVNTSGGLGGGGTIPIGAGVGASSGDFIFPPPWGPLAHDEAPNPCVTPESPPPSPGGADASTGIAPEVLAKASLKASALVYYLNGMLTSSMVDPSDATALAAAFEQGAPMAEMTVDNWLATVDPSTIPTAAPIPRYECTDEYQCPYKTQCFNSGAWSTSQPYECAVVNCGSAKCTACPDFFPDMLKSLVFESWCAYSCTVRMPPRDVVALGAIGYSKKYGFLPAKGAWCINP